MNKIVLIEDNNDMRENIQEILELDGYQVFTAENGKRGVEMIRQESPDLIICDIMMPELDGYGVLQIIAKDERTSRIPFIFLTAKAEKSDFRRGMNLGADDYLTKPFEDVELLKAVEIRINRNESLKKDVSRDTKGVKQFLHSSKENFHLSELSDDYISKLYKKKEVIFEAGKTAYYLYFVQKGKVKISKLNEDGKEYIMNVYGPGDFFGYQALLSGENYFETAEAIEESEVLSILKSDFLLLIHANEQLSKKFIQLLTHELKEAESRLIHLAYNSVRKRVAESLIMLDKKYNRDKLYPYSLSILREDLASIVGTAKESVIRTLSDLKDEGVINIESGKITILDPDLLADIPG
ncbi:MAG: response regulator [Chitinophagales bacterium]|nr:response regulator [Chitinophagales bacterium]